MLYHRARRTILWNILYYLLSLFCTFYLIKKVAILNWDVILVFLPLVLVAFSTETMSIKYEQDLKILRPYSIIDLIFKLLAYISSQLIYRHIAGGAFFWICICQFSICVVVSIICSILMIKRASNKQ